MCFVFCVSKLIWRERKHVRKEWEKMELGHIAGSQRLPNVNLQSVINERADDEAVSYFLSPITHLCHSHSQLDRGYAAAGD